MKLMTMRFRGFTWPVNPTSLRVELGKNVKETVLPFAGTHMADLGSKKRRVSGEGYFAGEECESLWRQMEAVFEEGAPGSLQLPGQEPFFAVMDGLSFLGREGPGLLRYGFTFVEHHTGESWRGQGRHLAAAGESLWDYAGRYGWDMEELRRANLHIRDIACLEQGEEVLSP